MRREEVDNDTLLEALAQNGLALPYASEQLQCDSNMQQQALRLPVIS